MVARRELREGSSPERTCIVTRAKGPPQDMIRFVVGPGKVVVPDIRRRLPGRGVWVSARADLVAKAVSQRDFSRGFKMKVEASGNLPVEIDGLLAKDCLQALSLVNKAGQVIFGFAKVEEAIGGPRLAGLIHAADCGAEGLRKLEGCVRRRRDGEEVPRINLFSSRQLDLALGRTNVVHAALMEGAASCLFLECCRRLMLFRSASPQAGASNRPSPVSEEKLGGCRLFRQSGSEWAGIETDERHEESR